MNKLSFILWLSDVLPSIGTAATILGALATAGSIALTILGVALFSDYEEEWDKVRKRCARAAWRLWPLAIVLIVASVLSPAKSTVMAIAASEAAEMAIASKDGQEITNDALIVIKSWLKAQIKDAAK